MTSLPADLSREDECLRLAAEVGEREDELHILVNNAGATWGEPFATFPASAWDKVLDLNLKGVFHLTKFLVPQLEAAGTHDDPARPQRQARLRLGQAARTRRAHFVVAIPPSTGMTAPVR